MYVERVSLTNFQCFGPGTVTIPLDGDLTAFIGNNGSGKTAVLVALMRVFGFNQEARRVQAQDFHVPADENPDQRPAARSLAVDVVLAFPELEDDGVGDDAGDQDPSGGADMSGTDAVPEFFHQMAADSTGALRCRFRLEAHWDDDGSVTGSITEDRRVIRTLDDDYGEQWSELPAADRARIQLIYLPAARDGAHHLAAFLRSRLWRAAQWSDSFRQRLAEVAKDLNEQFANEPAVGSAEIVLTKRWNELHSAGTDAAPSFRPVPREFAELVDRADLYFTPTHTGQERRAADLSDGQRSLLHLALTATAIDLEASIAAGNHQDAFDVAQLGLPTLTILAVEEPENSLSPFYLSRIVQQMLELGSSPRAQMVLASHSSSVLGRIRPEAVRHFRLDETNGTAQVNRISLPADADEAAKYVREAVRAYPELYFARFVVLGEGASEQVALPLLAAARNVFIDRSFVAVVPLGGRHVNHLWALLNQLRIPHATLLDLDDGRFGGGPARVRSLIKQFGETGQVLPEVSDEVNADNLDEWIRVLRDRNVFFCEPLDLDWSLLTAFWEEYTTLSDGAIGPDPTPAEQAVLGPKGDPSKYVGQGEALRWYRYLFLGRSKPATHLRVLPSIDSTRLCSKTPLELQALIGVIERAIS